MSDMKKTRLPLLLIYSLFITSCADMFENRISMQDATSYKDLSDIFSGQKTISKLSKPSQVFVTQAEYNNKIIISWNPVKEASSYHLERAIAAKDAKGEWITPAEEAFEPLEHSKFIYDTSFTDTIIDDSPANVLDYHNPSYKKAFFYRVSAENTSEGYDSSDFAISDNNNDSKPDPGILLAPPSNVKASLGESQTQITVNWQKADGDISFYEIYRSQSSDASGSSKLKTVYANECSYEDKITSDLQAINFYYTVYAVGRNGQRSVASSIGLGYALKDGAPARVTDVSIVKGRGDTNAVEGISITWNTTKNIKYRVYRSSSKDSTLKLIADDKTDADVSPNAGFQDPENIKPNIFYYYQVQSYKTDKDDKELLGPMSQSGADSENPCEGYIVSAPEEISVRKIQGDSSSNRIVFSKALGSEGCLNNSDYTKTNSLFNSYVYTVYGSNSPTGPFNASANLKLTEESDSQMAGSVDAYKYYQMITQNNSVSSEPSITVAPAPYAATNCSASDNAPIETSGDESMDRRSANENGVHAVRISWSAPEGGADGGYNIYRSTKKDSGFRKINDGPITDCEYLDNNDSAKAGSYYYYRILSLNSLGQGTEYSNTDSGYGALTTWQYIREYIKTTLNSQSKLTLMHKSGNTAKLGTETADGAICGTLSYDAHISGVSGRVIMEYKNYADFYIMDNPSLGIYFLLNGNTNTSAGIDTNGSMDGTVDIQGMYPGSVVYNNIQIKGGAAGGGTYGVTRKGIDSVAVQIDWKAGEK